MATLGMQYRAVQTAPQKQKDGQWVRKTTGFEQYDPDEEYWQLRQKMDATAAKYGYGKANTAGSATASTNTTGTGDIDKDWTNSNSNFSYNNTDLMAQAKELSQLQLANAKDMMGLSAGYRNQEYGFRAGTDRDTYSHKAGEDRTSYTAKTTDDMRVNNQQFGFQDALQRLKQTHELGMQEGQFKQQRSMFDAQQEADSRRKFNDRVAASNLYNTSRSAFPGMYNFRG